MLRVNGNEFIFKSYDFNRTTSVLALRYAFTQGDTFEETITFPPISGDLSAATEQALDKAFRLIFQLAGVSYYKATMLPRLVCEAFPLDKLTALFCQKVYHHGLGEFAYCNKIKRDITFVWDVEESVPAHSLGLSDKLLVPVGGGKDSIVTIEALKRAERDVTLFALGGQTLAEPIAQTIAVSGLPSLHVKRRICPNLIELNKHGALNGHVPITAILSSIAVACALMQGMGGVVLSNENSASAPNLICDGEEINHQYSKSLAFEKDFSGIVHDTVATDLAYYSLLRPLTETAIASRFAKCEAYHGVFRSCNTAFRQDEKARGSHWCCDCPKCRFVFLALAPFMSKNKLISIFGRNLLDDGKQIQGFRELCGISAFKPFECVGEVEESRLLILRLATMEEWQSDRVVAELSGLILPQESDSVHRFENLLKFRETHQLDKVMMGILHDA